MVFLIISYFNILFFKVKIKNPGAINKILSAKNNPSSHKSLVTGVEYLNVVEESAEEVIQISSTSSSTQRPAKKPGKQCSTRQQRKSTRQRPLK